MVHGCFLMPEYNSALSEQSWDFGHAGKSREKDATA
jgi:hypothetical protein